MEKYFDGFLYVANWGTHEFKLRLSSKLLSVNTARLYCSGDAASVREKAGKLIFTFLSEEEGGGEWVHGEGILSSLLPLRAELARGESPEPVSGVVIERASGALGQDVRSPGAAEPRQTIQRTFKSGRFSPR